MNVGATEFNPDVQTPGITFTSLNLTTFSLFDTHFSIKSYSLTPRRLCVSNPYKYGANRRLWGNLTETTENLRHSQSRWHTSISYISVGLAQDLGLASQTMVHALLLSSLRALFWHISIEDKPGGLARFFYFFSRLTVNPSAQVRQYWCCNSAENSAEI